MEISTTEIHSKLKEFFGFSSFKGEQEKVITHLLNGNDAFVLMPTGGGKSLCYQLPALLMPGTAIVVSPLIALMKNQVDAIRGFVAGNDGIAHFLNSSLSKAMLDEVKADLQAGITKLLYVAPESLTKEENIALLKEIRISFYAVDEAHCISDWGHDFRPEYRRIRPIVDEIGRAPIIALTATATPKVQSDILKNLGIPDAAVFKSSFNRPNLYYEVREKVEPDKQIIKFIKQNPGKSGIVYCLSRKKVEELSQLLVINGIRAVPYHAGLDAKVRAANQDMFLSEEVEVIVATIAFGMGIDKPDVRFVIHYDIPRSLEGYYQETGRAGRDGLEGVCIAFYCYRDICKLEKFMQSKPVSEQEIGRQILLDMVAYAESGECRRKLLLSYFGELYDQPNCGHCDNCINPKPKFDASKEICNVLRLVGSLPEHFKLEHISNILAGVANVLVKTYRHDKLELFGVGREKGLKFWEMITHQCLVLHFLERTVSNYALVGVSQRGQEYLDKPYPIMLAEERKFQDGDDDDDDELPAGMGKPGAGGDPVLMAMLKDLRKSVARKLGLQPWIVFTDVSLEDMTIRYPLTEKELTECQGVGAGKAKRYGEEFLSLIRRYVEENEIMRPDDFVVRVIPKSSDTAFIVHCIDKQMDFEDIADAKDMDMEELLSKVENMVAAGSRLNINYYIRQNIDQEVVDEIYEYFKEEAESDSLEEAMKVLGSDFDEMEVRLVRIKFLSEVAN